MTTQAKIWQISSGYWCRSCAYCGRTVTHPKGPAGRFQASDAVKNGRSCHGCPLKPKYRLTSVPALPQVKLCLGVNKESSIQTLTEKEPPAFKIKFVKAFSQKMNVHDNYTPPKAWNRYRIICIKCKGEQVKSIPAEWPQSVVASCVVCKVSQRLTV